MSHCHHPQTALSTLVLLDPYFSVSPFSVSQSAFRPEPDVSGGIGAGSFRFDIGGEKRHCWQSMFATWYYRFLFAGPRSKNQHENKTIASRIRFRADSAALPGAGQGTS